ncbi:MAG: hypothetical protein IKT27_06740, partial [Clostridia bacterium]|nr:hypothetical protein [Clostridia bacterium]
VIKNNTPSKSLPNNLFEINTSCIKANDNEQIFAFTNKGTCVKLKVKDIPLAVQWKGKGELLCDINKTFKFDENIISIMPIPENGEDVLIMFTKNGFAKRTKVSEYDINRSYFLAMTVKEDDELISVALEKEEKQIFAITEQSYSTKFNLNELELSKRTSVGSKIIKLLENDKIVYATPVGKIGSITLISKSGLAKKVPVSDYELLARYRRGLKTINLKNDKDKVVFAHFSIENFEIAYTAKEKIKALATADLPYSGRSAKGKQFEKQAIESAFVMLDKTNL